MQGTQATPSQDHPSVLQSLNLVSRRLERALLALGNGAGAEAELRAIADELARAVDRSPDVALASIYLNQIAGLYAVHHCVEAAIIALLLARSMEKPPHETESIVAAALTMNAGMVRQSEVYQLNDTPLSDAERAAVRRHPDEGAELLRLAGIGDEKWITYVRMHHEVEDGSGYPAGSRDVPQNARLVGLADRYCALVSARNYRRSLQPPEACRKLVAECGDAAVGWHLERQVGLYPPGTLVRLHVGETGVVMSRAGPLVHALRSADGTPLAPAKIRAASDPDYAIDAALHEDDARLRFSMRQVWGEDAAL